MRFNFLATAVGALTVMSTPAFAAVTVTKMVTNIKMLTMKSKALQAPAKSITPVNGVLLAVGQGPFPVIIAGFTDIVATATGAIAEMKGSKKVGPGAPAQAVANAFREFVMIHQQLLSILIGKGGLLTIVPFIGEPVAAVLRLIEGVVDAIANAIIDLIDPSVKKSLMSDGAKLKGTLKDAEKQYSSLGVLDLGLGSIGGRAVPFEA